ncbi:MAG: hypothetical protein HC902_05485 [Calothrix sp. SM1_5_4]|nr:hypothetical protein [Calothrix sp. SM1_5_4]
MRFGFTTYLAGILASFLPFTAYAHSNKESVSPPNVRSVVPREENIQLVVTWLTSRKVMDMLSATELALSLTENELSALAEALKDPKIKLAEKDVMPY